MDAAERADWLARMRDFAAAEVAPRRLAETDEWPADLWAGLGEQGFLGLGIARDFGGAGGDLALLAAVGEALARHGRSLGFTMAWMSHNVIAHVLLQRHGNGEQNGRYLPDLAAGRLSCAVAISEPGAGAHPKHLRATARPADDGGWRIDGEKTWITNGPLAGLYIVLAISDERDGRKAFSAFLVPRDAPGLTVSKMPPIGFYRPSGHADLALRDCRVAGAAVLGRAGAAFADLSIPFRAFEDGTGTGALAGAARAQADLLARSIETSGIALDDEALGALGAIAAHAEALSAVSAQIVAKLDRDGASRPGMERALEAGFRVAVQDGQQRVRDLRERFALGDNGPLGVLIRDIHQSLTVARVARQIGQQRIGEAVIAAARRTAA